MSLIIGCDPGKTGCACLVDFTEGGAYALSIFSIAGGDIHGMYGYDPEAMRVLSTTANYRAFIELPQTRFKNSATSTLTTGIGYGFLLSCLQLANPYKTECVEAKTWKSALGLVGPGGPKESKKRSIEFLNHTCLNANEANAMRKGTPINLDGLADAFGIACYGFKTMNETP